MAKLSETTIEVFERLPVGGSWMKYMDWRRDSDRGFHNRLKALHRAGLIEQQYDDSGIWYRRRTALRTKGADRD